MVMLYPSVVKEPLQPECPHYYSLLFQIDQPGFGLPGRNYYLEDQFIEQQDAYVKFASSVAVLYGADPQTAETAMRDVLRFETDIANVRHQFCST